jgi:hypothetical protein
MRPSYSWSRSPKRPKASRRELGGVEGFPCAQVSRRWSAMQAWPRSTRLLRHLTLRRRINPHSSRIAKPNKKLQRYGLRKRTARHMASDKKSLGDASRHLNILKKPKRTPTFIRAQLLALQLLLLALWLLGLQLLLLALQ